MAKYDKDTKFYWLQLKEDFFEEDAIEWLEEQENGHKYSLFYLKLCLKSLKTNGVLIRKVGNMFVPYDAKKLGAITNTPTDTVIIAMELLKNIGLVQILESGEIYLTQIENMVGSASRSALKKQQQRALQKKALLLEGGQGVDNCPPMCPPKIEIENRDKDIDKEIKKETRHKYGEYNNVLLSDEQYSKLKEEFPNDYQERIERLSEYIESTGKKYKNHLATIRSWAKRDKGNKPTKKVIDESMNDLDDLF